MHTHMYTPVHTDTTRYRGGGLDRHTRMHARMRAHARDSHRFYLVTLEVEVVGAPCVAAIVRAQEAVSRADATSVLLLQVRTLLRLMTNEFSSLQHELAAIEKHTRAMARAIRRMHERCLPQVYLSTAPSCPSCLPTCLPDLPVCCQCGCICERAFHLMCLHCTTIGILRADPTVPLGHQGWPGAAQWCPLQRLRTRRRDTILSLWWYASAHMRPFDGSLIASFCLQVRPRNRRCHKHWTSASMSRTTPLPVHASICEACAPTCSVSTANSSRRWSRARRYAHFACTGQCGCILCVHGFIHAGARLRAHESCAPAPCGGVRPVHRCTRTRTHAHMF